MTHRISLVLLLALSWLAAPALADVSLPQFFSNHVVL